MPSCSTLQGGGLSHPTKQSAHHISDGDKIPSFPQLPTLRRAPFMQGVGDVMTTLVQTTPPVSIVSATEDPAKANRTHDVDCLPVNLPRERLAILQGLSAVPVVGLDWFLSNLLPKPFSGPKTKNYLNIDNIVAQLVSNGAREAGRWSVPLMNPKASKLGEGFQQVVEAIATAVGDPNINSYILRPDEAPASEKGSEFRPDGFFARGNEAAQWPPEWWDIACPTGFSKSCSEAAFKNNIAGVIWSMYRIMREDARRRFTFGVTVEGTNTRFWFTSRSTILVSQPFDFTKDPKPLIRMVYFLSHASEEQLGYDATMRRFRDPAGQCQLVIDIGGQNFRTEKLLADFAANSLLGRGTRVWSGSFEDGTPAVLKDYWVERDRKLDGDILATLREEYGKLTASDKPNFDDHFLTVIAHGNTRLTGGAEDDTQEMMNGEVLATNDWLVIADYVNHHKLRLSRCSYVSTSRELNIKYAMRRGFKRRRHYRISFKEVATPLYEVVKLQDYSSARKYCMWSTGGKSSTNPASPKLE